MLRKCGLFHWQTICISGVWLVYVHGGESEIQASRWCRWSVEQSPTFPWSHHFSDQPILGQGCHPYRGNVYTYAKVLRDFNENQHLLLQWIRQREILIQLRRSKDLFKTSQLKKKLINCESVQGHQFGEVRMFLEHNVNCSLQTWAVVDVFPLGERKDGVYIFTNTILFQRLVHVNLISDPLVYVQKDNTIHVLNDADIKNL